MTLSTLQNYEHFGLPVWEDDNGDLFAVAVDGDADYQAAENAIRTSVWSMDPALLVNYFEGIEDEPNVSQVISEIQDLQVAEMENCNLNILDRIGDNIYEFVDDIIATQGMARYLCTEDVSSLDYNELSEDLLTAIATEYCMSDNGVSEILAYPI